MELRRSPLQSPITTGTVLIAGAVTVAWWTGQDVSRLLMTPAAVGREPWRLFTSALLHVNVLHLAFNALWVWTFGSVLETQLGAVRYGALVVVLAVGSGAAELALAGSGVGLSGVGYGFFGFLWAARRAGVDYAEEVLDDRVVMLFVGWFFFCIVATWLDWMRVANVAHGAGALFGALAGSLVRRGYARIAAAVGLATLFAASVVGAGPLRERVNLTGDVARDLGQQADQALDDGEPARAAGLYERALVKAPDDARLWYNLSVAYHRLERWDDAVAAAEKAAVLEPEHETYPDGLAMAYGRQGSERFTAGDLEGAAAAYERARDQAPHERSYHLNLALALESLDRVDEARAVLDAAKRRWPDDPAIRAALETLP